MNILVIGLGLIGGSFCKALSAKTDHCIFGYDTNSDTIKNASADGSISEYLEPENFSKADLTIICLHPEVAVKVFSQNAGFFRKNSIVADVCGVKSDICAKMSSVAEKYGLRYVGTHPMAGREFGGYNYSVPELFENRSFIVTPLENTDSEALETVEKLASEVGFTRIVKSSPEAHDKTIAYTSQLAHIVSSAYVKSPTIENESGFTAGSFQDMTRIATVNENMWTNLLMQNKGPLL